MYKMSRLVQIRVDYAYICIVRGGGADCSGGGGNGDGGVRHKGGRGRDDRAHWNWHQQAR